MSNNGLVSDLSGRGPDATKTSCGLTRLVNSLEGAERTSLENAITKIKEDRGLGRAKVYSSSWLAGVLRKNGYNISASTITRHIKGGCNCE